METIAIVSTTVPPGQAERIADALVAEHLAACVQHEPITSRYRWHGVVERSDEVRLSAKTSPPLALRLVERIEALHPYDVPEILLTHAEASPAYAHWVAQQVRA